MRGLLIVCTDDQGLAELAASRVIELGKLAIQRQGFFRLLLSGGRGPQGMFSRLAAQPGALPWHKMRVFWSDERWVPTADPESNFGQAKRLFLDLLPSRPQLHPLLGSPDSVDDSALAYETMLKAEFGSATTPFDLCLLGMGADGHTASLFAGSPLLDETRRLCAPAIQPVSGQQRLTLTLPCLNASRHIVFLVRGAEKSGVLGTIRRGEDGWESLPAAMIQPVAGTLEWIVTAESFGAP